MAHQGGTTPAPCSFTGRALQVDLTQGLMKTETLDEGFHRRYLSGWGTIPHYLLREVPPRSDPLGPVNCSVFATGVVTGLPLRSARHAQFLHERVAGIAVPEAVRRRMAEAEVVTEVLGPCAFHALSYCNIHGLWESSKELRVV